MAKNEIDRLAQFRINNLRAWEEVLSNISPLQGVRTFEGPTAIVNVLNSVLGSLEVVACLPGGGDAELEKAVLSGNRITLRAAGRLSYIILPKRLRVVQTLIPNSSFMIFEPSLSRNIRITRNSVEHNVELPDNLINTNKLLMENYL